MKYLDQLVKKMSSFTDVYIYGARTVAKEAAICFMSEPYSLNIKGFLVTSAEGNPETLFDLPVYVFGNNIDYSDALIIIAAMDKYVDEIADNLRRNGCLNILPLGFESDLWSELRGNYFMEMQKKIGKPYLILEDELLNVNEYDDYKNKLSVYRVLSHKDRALSANMECFDWEIPIQAGKSLSDIQICELTDEDADDDISLLNPYYCELTALYWIWKHDKSDYTGICHYRRHFCIDEINRKKLLNSDIDVVLTIPVINYPNVKATYEVDHIKSDWDIMMDVLNEKYPVYYTVADKIQNGNYYYAYNMLIARREVLAEYCKWLFSVLKECHNRIGDREDPYQRRYLGFLAERLMTIYFVSHDELKIVHANKHFFTK